MKLIKTFVLLFFASGLALAQNVSYEYFTRNWEKTTQRQAYFIRKITQLESDSVLYFVSDSAANGSVIKKGYYKSLNPEVEHGYFMFMFKNRNEIYTGNYNNGEMIGVWHVSDLHGNEIKNADYDFELTTIETELVEPVGVFITYEQMPTFEGGEVELLKYIANNIMYPPKALFYDVRGRVFCQFLIDTTGQVANVKILRSVDKDLDKEALRIIADCPPKWTPGGGGGKKVRMYYQVPITFSLPNNRRRF